ncbi:MAG: hypothetical protein HZB65_04410, partial [Candidatus Aenigmarchaeota archaeon]|nr:hypothetical protein [Candidatus Aenigmarchaeota archaeon]
MKKLLMIVIFLLLVAGIGYSSISSTIPMQGRLLGQGGNPLTGLQNMTFAIYETVSGGNVLWSESLQTQTNNGLFSVVLGESAAMNLVFDKDYYVEISVNGETLSPRQKLLASPYSQSARNVYGDVVEIKGPVTVVDNDNTGYIRIGRDITNAIGATIRYIQNGDYLGLSASHEGQDALVIRSDGNVGIGTTNPEHRLDVNGAINIPVNTPYRINNNAILGTGNSSYTYIREYSASGIQFQDSSGYAKAIITSAGEVGIGTLFPSKRLDVNGSVKATELCIGNDCRTEWTVASSQLNIVALNTTGNITSAGSMKMAGNLLIGLQSPVIKSMASASQTGGTLTNPTQYCYRVSAVNSAGETKASGSQCITTQAGHNTVTMQWDTVQFAASYNIYGRTAG